jgi:hypothetical protein
MWRLRDLYQWERWEGVECNGVGKGLWIGHWTRMGKGEQWVGRG